MQPTIRENCLTIFTDGSSTGRRRAGGMGIVFVRIDDSGEEDIDEIMPVGQMGATSQDMELEACRRALDLAPSHVWYPGAQEIWLYTDSRFVADNYPNALSAWPKSKWRTRDGAHVVHKDEWKALVRARKRIQKRVEIVWAQGHSKDNPYNAKADALAKQSAQTPFCRRRRVSTARRKLFGGKTQPGSVRAAGQELVVRILEDEKISGEELYRYRYEVVDSLSNQRGAIDFACSEHLLRPAHHYKVQFGENAANPEIVNVIGETKSSCKNRDELYDMVD
jgi:ribonuclease HI